MSSKSAPGTSKGPAKRVGKPSSLGPVGVRRKPVSSSGKSSASGLRPVLVPALPVPAVGLLAAEPKSDHLEKPADVLLVDVVPVALVHELQGEELKSGEILLPDVEASEVVIGSLMASSTPAAAGSEMSRLELGHARSDSSLLRIRTQLRQAKAAELGEAMAACDIDAAYSDLEGDESDTSLNSSTRTVDGRRIILNEMPRQANAVLQQAKADLERSGNLKRDIRDSVVSALHVLYEMVLKVSDSRTLHMLEAQRLRTGQAKDQERITARHARALELALNEYRGLRDGMDRINRDSEILEELKQGMDRIHRDAETLRQILSIDLSDPIKSIERGTDVIRKEVGQVKVVVEAVRGVALELQQTRDMASVNSTVVCPPAPLTRSDMDELKDGMREVVREIRGSSAVEALPVEAVDLVPHSVNTDEICLAVRDVMMAVAKEHRDLGPVMELCGGTYAVVQSISKEVEEIKSAAVPRETAMVLSSRVDDIKRSLAELKDSTVETTAPIRMAVEDLRREIKLAEGASDSVLDMQKSQKALPPSLVTSPGIGTLSASYKEALMRPRYPVMVKSVDPQHSSSDVVQSLKEKVDVVQLGIGVSSLRMVRNQKVVINCDSEMDRNVLKEAIGKLSQKLTVSQPSVKLPLLRLMGVANDLSNAKLEEALITQNQKLLPVPMPEKVVVRVLRRSRVRNNARSNVVLEVSPSLWSSFRDRELRVGYQIVSAIDQSPVVQCYRCLAFGHIARDCKEGIRCGYCSEEHDTRECRNRNSAPRCVNCAQSKQASSVIHPAYAVECPEWQRWDRLSRNMTSYF